MDKFALRRSICLPRDSTDIALPPFLIRWTAKETAHSNDSYVARGRGNLRQTRSPRSASFQRPAARRPDGVRCFSSAGTARAPRLAAQRSMSASRTQPDHTTTGRRLPQLIHTRVAFTSFRSHREGAPAHARSRRAKLCVPRVPFLSARTATKARSEVPFVRASGQDKKSGGPPAAQQRGRGWQTKAPPAE